MRRVLCCFVVETDLEDDELERRLSDKLKEALKRARRMRIEKDNRPVVVERTLLPLPSRGS
jgi:hypothetical protein